MDFRTRQDDYFFWVRATALIVRDGCIYLCQSPDGGYHSIGGAIAVGETTEDAVRREVREELGCDIQVDQLAFVVENYFESDHKKVHRIEFQYLVTPLSEPNRMLVEGDTQRRCEWLPIDQLDTIDVKPAFLKTALKNWDGQVKHVVNREGTSNER
ncbi:NUDIX hydrolase [Streptococcus ovuberis]|uniref:NUDIX domain-containing protein n=1 Tax=Streptococcus ovuberis TaxID=1936207 RepID=A0A7X6S0X3_9STRE|nr:NUDIX domain-containing protein [Streptococcus ovuberis]NKZ20584.1 NUDIX domain-containing protein [Streptococcus ovuberis]